jgi:hypothetical protein
MMLCPSGSIGTRVPTGIGGPGKFQDATTVAV